jgi:hypothetical protein
MLLATSLAALHVTLLWWALGLRRSTIIMILLLPVSNTIPGTSGLAVDFGLRDTGA